MLAQALTVSLLGVCDREGCGRPRARNPRNGKIHPFCSLRCSRTDSSDQPSNATTDFAMDLVIALEMSRLQLIEDEVRKRNLDLPGDTQPRQPSADIFSEESQLRLAIRLSLEESRKLVTDSIVTSVCDPADLTVDKFLTTLENKQGYNITDCPTSQLDSENSSKSLKTFFGKS